MILINTVQIWILYLIILVNFQDKESCFHPTRKREGFSQHTYNKKVNPKEGSFYRVKIVKKNSGPNE